MGRLTSLVYSELRHLAHSYMLREMPGHTLRTTALVHEAYLRLIDARNVDWRDRAHFFGICARLMRQVLVEFARSRGARKRGGEAREVDFDDAGVAATGRDADLASLASVWQSSGEGVEAVGHARLPEQHGKNQTHHGKQVPRLRPQDV